MLVITQIDSIIKLTWSEKNVLTLELASNKTSAHDF